MRTARFPAWLGLVILSRLAAAQDIPVVSALRSAPSGFQARLVYASSSAYNTPGNVLIGQSGRGGGGADLLVELAADGSTVWECRLAPAGTLSGFWRAPDGTTLVNQWRPGAFSRVLVLDRQGDFRRGWSVRGRGDEPPPQVMTTREAVDGGLAGSVPGYAFIVTRQGRLTMQWVHGKLKSATPLPDGRWLAALSRPERFAVYDPATRALATLPLDGFCHLWEADRGEPDGPSGFRLYGCFCMPTDGAPVNGVRPRKTIEIADTDAGGGLRATYGSPRALRVDDFGTERCAIFSRGLIRLASGGTLILNAYPADCRIEEQAPDGSVRRVLFGATSTPGASSFGEDACPLVGLQELGPPAPSAGEPRKVQ